MFDIVENMPIAECITKKENNKTVKEFISKSIPGHKRIAIITDSKNGYSTVMRELGFKYHQHCTFHLLQRVVDKIKKEVNKSLNQYKNEIKEENPKISKNKLKKLLNDKNKELWKEYQIYIDKIKLIFKQDTRNAAVEKINEIKRKINQYPNFIAVYLKNNFFPKYAQYLVFLEKNIKKYLEKTNNKIENYIENILDKSKKRIFRTVQRLFSPIFHRKDG